MECQCREAGLSVFFRWSLRAEDSCSRSCSQCSEPVQSGFVAPSASRVHEGPSTLQTVLSPGGLFLGPVPWEVAPSTTVLSHSQSGAGLVVVPLWTEVALVRKAAERPSQTVLFSFTCSSRGQCCCPLVPPKSLWACQHACSVVPDPGHLCPPPALPGVHFCPAPFSPSVSCLLPHWSCRVPRKACELVQLPVVLQALRTGPASCCHLQPYFLPAPGLSQHLGWCLELAVRDLPRSTWKW